MNSRGRKRLSRRSDKTSSTEQCESIRAAARGFDTFESGNRRIPIVNHHGMSGPDLPQIGAKVILQL
jgi:hypothetical protein